MGLKKAMPDWINGKIRPVLYKQIKSRIGIQTPFRDFDFEFLPFYLLTGLHIYFHTACLNSLLRQAVKHAPGPGITLDIIVGVKG